MLWHVDRAMRYARRVSEFVIHGGQPISGEITVGGNKNAVLPMLAATLLTDQEVVLENVPDILDVASMLDILRHLGADVSKDGRTVRVRAANVHTHEVPARFCEATRTSFLLAGPLLCRMGHAKLAPPGGDQIGRRRLDSHFYGMRKLGVEVDERHFDFEAKRLSGCHMFFDEPSVTATEHVLMMAVLAKGTTTMLNVASEPHVQDLVKLLAAMGARIDGSGTNTLVVEGVGALGGATHRVVSDHIEAVSYLALAAATGGELTVYDTVPGHYWMTHRVFERFNLDFHNEPGKLFLPGGQRPRVSQDAGGAIPRVADGPWPQFPSDMMSVMLVLATQAEGTVLFFEKMFESRMYFVDPLIRMGANIIVCDPHRVVVTGRTELREQTMRSPDIRAGMALMGAALCANGRCVVQNAEIIDRGYERIEEKLASIGAGIVREGHT